MTMPRIEALTQKISDEDFRQLAALFCTVYPEQQRDEGEFAESLRQAWAEYSGPANLRARYVVREGGVVVANATLSPRQIMTARGPRTIAALYDVMTHPKFRGRGLGNALVRVVFDRVDGGEYAFSLFQTGKANEFYEKLGCRVVTDPIVNSRDRQNPRANPFWERWVMCYDPRGELAPGEIDLLGPGY